MNKSTVHPELPWVTRGVLLSCLIRPLCRNSSCNSPFTGCLWCRGFNRCTSPKETAPWPFVPFDSAYRFGCLLNLCFRFLTYYLNKKRHHLQYVFRTFGLPAINLPKGEKAEYSPSCRAEAECLQFYICLMSFLWCIINMTLQTLHSRTVLHEMLCHIRHTSCAGDQTERLFCF